jgi:hypothetical protein
MPDQLTAPAEPAGPTPSHGRSGRGVVVLQFVLAVLVLAGVGALAGVVWEWVWSPAVGVVADHQWVAEDEAGLRGQFSGTGWFVVVATVAGLVAGVVVALFLDRVPLLTLLAVVVGSVVGTWLMLHVGSALGPPDPDHLARTAKGGTHLPAQLEVSRRSPWIALPAGALVGLAVVFVGLSRRSGNRD